MAKKTDHLDDGIDNSMGMRQEGDEAMPFAADFSLSDEYKPEPLVPNGVYFANVTEVTFNSEQQCIVWKLAIDGTEAMMTDGVTPVNGVNLFFRNWLPKPGDDTEMTRNGRSTKRQWKINALTRFATAMQIDMNSPAAINQALLNQEWVGLEVYIEVTTSEYEGQFRNDIKSMRRAQQA